MEMRLRDTPQWGRDRDREAHMKIPTRTCQSFTAATDKCDFNGLLGPGAIPGAARTEIHFDNSGIVEIYHRDNRSDRDGGEAERGENSGKGASRVHILGLLLYEHLRLRVAVSHIRSGGKDGGDPLANIYCAVGEKWGCSLSIREISDGDWPCSAALPS
jgi:hypothetical protein